MLNHILTHLTTPMQVLMIALSVWKLADIIMYFRRKHNESKNK